MWQYNNSDEKKAKAVKSLQNYQTKINKKLSKLDKSDAQLNKQRDAQSKSGAITATKYRQEAARLRGKKYGLFTSKSKADKLESKATKLDVKAEQIESKINTTKAKLEKNATYRKLYNTSLNQINSALKEKGKKYLNS